MRNLILTDQTLCHEATLKFDGGAQPNPGRGGWGFVLVDDCGTEIEHNFGSMGHVTNNIAEYEGLIQGLKKASEHGIRRLRVQGDSLLVINQMTGDYQVRSAHLQAYHTRAIDVQSKFICVEFEHVLRKDNSEADKLAKKGIVMSQLQKQLGPRGLHLLVTKGQINKSLKRSRRARIPKLISLAL